MSEENVEIVRRCYESLARRDWVEIWQDVSPAFALETQRQGSYRGPDEVRDFIRDQISAFASWTQTTDEFIARGNRVVVLVTQRAQPKGTTAEIQAKIAHLWTLQDGKILLLETFPRREDAIEAAGLRE